MSSLAGFREGQGPDYFAYLALFNDLSENPYLEAKKPLLGSQEIFFRLFGSGLKYFGFNYRGYLCAVAMISMWFVGRTALRFSPYPMLTLLLFFSAFFFVWPYSGIRQGMALCIGTYYLLSCAEQKNHLKMAFVTVVLSAVHLSALFLIFFYAISVFYKPLYPVLILCVTALLSLVFSEQIFGMFVSSVPFAERIFFYEDEFGAASLFDFKTGARLAFSIFGFFVLMGSKKAQPAFVLTVSYVFISSFFVYVLFKHSEIVAAQLSLYGYFYLVLLGPWWLKSKDWIPASVKLVLILAISVAYFFKTYSDMVFMSEENQSNIILVSWVAPLQNFGRG